MKATGVVRRIDDLGRIVIPKEIRKFKNERGRVVITIIGTIKSSWKKIEIANISIKKYGVRRMHKKW